MNLRERQTIMRRDGFTCQQCGRKPPEVVLEIDHKKPLSSGGDDSPDNAQLLCRECNRGKSNHWDDKAAPLSFVGLWFHSFGDNGLEWQGKITQEVNPGYYLIVVLDWVTGDYGSCRLIQIADMLSWWFYESAEEMRTAFEFQHKYKIRKVKEA